MTLRLRILLGYLLLLGGAFSFIMYLIMADVRPRYLEAVEESLVDTAELLAALLAQHVNGETLHTDAVEAAMKRLSEREFSAQIYHARKRRVDLRVYVTDERGIIVYDSAGLAKPGDDYSRWNDVYLTLRGQYGARATRTVKSDPGTSVMYVAAPVMKDGVLLAVVSVGKPQDSTTFFIDIVRNKLRFTLVLVGLTTAALAALLSIWVTRPIAGLTAYVRSVRQGDKQPAPALGPPELRALGEAVGEMQSKLEGKSYIEDYVRALTHEMKSPLTGIKGACEILGEQVADAQARKFLDNIDSDAQRMHSLVERMLQLSRLENVRAVRKAAIPAGPFFRELKDSFCSRLERGAIQFETEIAPGLSLHGDAFLLRQAVSNLIANAIDFSPPGSAITLFASPDPDSGNGVQIRIRDQGEGMPHFALEKAFDKFFSLARPGNGKKSTGLGLPFVKEVVALHGGSIAIANREPGLEVVLRLPGE